MAAQVELGQPVLRELGRTVLIGRLGDVVELMSEQNEDTVPVISPDGKTVVGVLTSRDIVNAYKYRLLEENAATANFSLKRQRIKMLIKGRRLIKM